MGWTTDRELRRNFSLVAITLGYFVALHTVVTSTIRYRYALLPLVVLLAAAQLARLWTQWKLRPPASLDHSSASN